MADPGRHVHLVSGSRAEDVGYQTAADTALLCAEARIDYRLIGGLSVSLIHAAQRAPGEVPPRLTADVDLGADDRMVAESGLDVRLLRRGYRMTHGNRFVKEEGGMGACHRHPDSHSGRSAAQQCRMRSADRRCGAWPPTRAVH